MKTLVTGALQASEEELNTLRSLGLEITLHPDERQPVGQPEQYEAVICNGLFLYNDIQAYSAHQRRHGSGAHGLHTKPRHRDSQRRRGIQRSHGGVDAHAHSGAV